MNAKEKLVNELLPIGLYNLDDENSLIDKELSSYAKVLEELEHNIDALKSEMFFSSAQNKGKERFKCLFGVAEYGDEQAGEYISELMKTPFASWNKALWDMEEEIAEFECYDSPLLQYFTVYNYNTFSVDKKAAITKLVRKYVPCHMRIGLRIAERSWDSFEALGLNFTQAESIALSFDEIEYF